MPVPSWFACSRLDAIGPDPGEPEQSEALPQAPSEWYLTGFLVPYQAKAEERQDPTSNEDVDQGGDAGGTDDDRRSTRSRRRGGRFCRRRSGSACWCRRRRRSFRRR